jgi:hypothetical protein
MKKIISLILLVFVIHNNANSQNLAVINAPPYDISTSNLALANGSSAHIYYRASFLILQSELTGLALTNSVITNVLINYLQGANYGPVGQFTLYLQNTNDNFYNKGTLWSNIINGMTVCYNGNFSIPVTPPFSGFSPNSSISSTGLSISQVFTYTGGGLYVSCDWYCPLSFSSQLAVIPCNSSGLANGAVRGYINGGGPAPTNLNVSSFRPCISLIAQNTATNELSISDIKALGSSSKLTGSSQTITAVLKNLSIATRSNIAVSLNISGANTFTNSQTIPTIAPGSSVLVTFAAYTPTINGINSMSVSILPDQNLLNNSAVWSQSTTCNRVGIPLASLSVNNFTNYAYGAGPSGFIFSFSYTTGVNTSSLDAVNCIIPGDPSYNNSGNTICPVLCDNTGSVIATGNTLTIAANNLNALNTLIFPSKPLLLPNTSYYIGIAVIGSPNANYFPIGTLLQSVWNFNGYYGIPLNGGAGGLPMSYSNGFFGIDALLVFPSTNINAVSSNSIICANSTVTLTASGAPTTYTWNNVSGIIPSINGIATVTPSIPGAFSFSVIGSAPNGCNSGPAVITISVNPTPTISVMGIGNYSICLNQSISIFASGAISYTWFPGNFNGFFQALSPSVTTNYSVSGLNSLGCISSSPAIASITVAPLPIISLNNGSICIGQSFTLNPSGASNYIFSSGSAIVSPTITSSYSVSGTNSLGCSSAIPALASIIVITRPIISISNASICSGQSFTLNPSGAINYSFSSGSAIVNPTITSSYSVSGTNSLGCVSFSPAVVTITVFAGPPITVNSGSICFGQSYTLTPTGAINYTFSSGSSIVSPTTTISYSVSGNNSIGCSATAVANVSVFALPNVIILGNQIVCLGDETILTATGANSYTWSGGANWSTISGTNNIVISPTSNSTFTASGSSIEGCLGSSSVLITVLPCTSIESISSQNTIKLYPNPNNGNFIVELFKNIDATIFIHNLLGQVILSKKAGLINNIELGDLNSGVYLITIKKSNAIIYSQSIIKQ